LIYEQALGITKSDNGDRKTDFDISKYRENMSLECPLRDGQIADWELLEKIWEHAMNRYMKVDIKESPVLIAEKPQNPPAARQQYVSSVY
jgi:actin-related protein